MNNLDKLRYYQISRELFELCRTDCDILMKDLRGREIAKQVIRSVGSISANIEEGYGRGYGKEYPRFLKISRGSAQESRGWYLKSKFLLDQNLIADRTSKLDSIIAMLTKTIETLYKK